MTTTGVQSFANDDAVEWAAAYREMGFGLAESTIRIALEDYSNNRLSAGIAARAIAAVEAVALALGRGSPDAERAFQGAAPADRAAAEQIVGEADEALTAIIKNSGLANTWEEAGAGPHRAWVEAVETLRNRLQGAKAEAPAPAPSPAPMAQESASPSAQVSGDDVTEAILSLSRDIEQLRREMAQGFARLSRQLGEGSK